ncbi:MAG: MurR/RpiR family transcriptional regulator [Oscillospiraceae bacterium]|nr:MurR/RpiR family transcriptional regulator [Oscillospiraceae bacterium]
MNKGNVLDAITAIYPTLTKSGKKLADFILDNKVEAQYMSITSLAEECNVADATVSRFCKTLGYDGYNEFKLALAKASGTKMTEVGIEAYNKIDAEDSIITMAEKLYASEIASINQTLQELDSNAIARTVQYLHAAQRVYCFGQGASCVMAMEAWARFLTAAPQFHCIEDSHMQTMAASMCSINDVILFFSYSGATKDMVDVLKPAKERGAKIILITHFSKSPAAAFADIILFCGSRESPLQSGSVAAKMGQLFLIDVLFNEFCRANSAFVDVNRENTTSAIAAKLL